MSEFESLVKRCVANGFEVKVLKIPNHQEYIISVSHYLEDVKKFNTVQRGGVSLEHIASDMTVLINEFKMFEQLQDPTINADV